MSTLAVPITDLFPLVVKAKDETGLVKECSYVEEASLKAVWQIALGTFAGKPRLSQLAARKHSLLAELASNDFTHWTDDQLRELALAI